LDKQERGRVPPDVLEVTAAVPREFPPYYGVDDHGKPEKFAIDVMERLAAISVSPIRISPSGPFTRVSTLRCST